MASKQPLQDRFYNYLKAVYSKGDGIWVSYQTLYNNARKAGYSRDEILEAVRLLDEYTADVVTDSRGGKRFYKFVELPIGMKEAMEKAYRQFDEL